MSPIEDVLGKIGSALRARPEEQIFEAAATGAVPIEVAAGQKLLRMLAHDRPLTTLDEVESAVLRRLKRYHVVGERDGIGIEVPFVARWVRERKGDPEPRVNAAGAPEAPTVLDPATNIPG